MISLETTRDQPRGKAGTKEGAPKLPKPELTPSLQEWGHLVRFTSQKERQEILAGKGAALRPQIETRRTKYNAGIYTPENAPREVLIFAWSHVNNQEVPSDKRVPPRQQNKFLGDFCREFSGRHSTNLACKAKDQSGRLLISKKGLGVICTFVKNDFKYGNKVLQDIDIPTDTEALTEKEELLTKLESLQTEAKGDFESAFTSYKTMLREETISLTDNQIACYALRIAVATLELVNYKPAKN